MVPHTRMDPNYLQFLLIFYIFRIKNNWDNVIWVHKDAKKIELKKGTIKFEIGGATF